MKEDSKLYKYERERSAGYMTNWAARLFYRAIDRKLKPLGLAPGHLAMFFALSNGEALSQKALTDFAAIEQPTMAATLARMERDGLIQRVPDPADRRSMLISLTPGALEKVPAVFDAIFTVNGEALANLSEAERETFLSLLQRVVATLERVDKI